MRKTWAGNAALLSAKGAIRPGVRFIGAVRAKNFSHTKPFSLNTFTAVPAPGKAWPVAVVTGRGMLVAPIVTAINVITLVCYIITYILSNNFTCEFGRIRITVRAH